MKLARRKVLIAGAATVVAAAGIGSAFAGFIEGALAALIFFSASVMFLPPPTFAGSDFGPTSTKSLYMTGWRFTPCPSAMNFSSAAFACCSVLTAPARDQRSAKSRVICSSTFGSTTRVSPLSGSFSE